MVILAPLGVITNLGGIHAALDVNVTPVTYFKTTAIITLGVLTFAPAAIATVTDDVSFRALTADAPVPETDPYWDAAYQLASNLMGTTVL